MRTLNEYAHPHPIECPAISFISNAKKLSILGTKEKESSKEEPLRFSKGISTTLILISTKYI